MKSQDSVSIRFAFAIPAAILLILTLLYWKYRIIDLAVGGTPVFHSGDLYNQYYPMISYGFRSLRAGLLPLWNPFQLCGGPFLAVPYVGLFYPANVVYLFVDVATGIELVFILHMFFAAVSMWFLQRHFGISSLGGLCSALTFVWSGWLIYNANQIPIFAGLAWMPATVLLFDRASSGRRGALLGLIAAVTCQLLLGATETMVHNLYVGAFFACLRLATIARQDGWAAFLRRSTLLAACVVAGVLLAAPQLFPTVELVGLSNRAAGELTYDQAVEMSRPVSWVLLNALGSRANVALGFQPLPIIGILPLLGIPLAFGHRAYRRVGIGAVVISTLSLLLVSGDPFFRLYYALPWGDLFRRPEKFLSIYQFGLALLAGVAISQLQSWRVLARGELWRRSAWLAAFGLATILVGVGLKVAVPNTPALVGDRQFGLADSFSPLPIGVSFAMFGLLLAYGSLASSRARTAIITCILVVQVASVFFTTGNQSPRPMQQPEIFRLSMPVKDFLKKLPGYHRTYVFHSPGSPLLEPGFTLKDGILNGIEFLTDYDSLILARYTPFFDRLAGQRLIPGWNFVGDFPLTPMSRWGLMNLTSTKYFVIDDKNPANRLLRTRSRSRSARPRRRPSFRQIYSQGVLRVHEMLGVLPRAYLVPEARVIEDPDQLLDSLDDPAFDPREEVLIEETPLEQVSSGVHSASMESVRIVRYRPEEVIIEVVSDHSGYLVLTDAFYPGWTAFVNGLETRIYRANYLFRSVQLQAGSNTVRFVYRPKSLRVGVLLSALCAVGLAVFFTRGSWWRRV